MADRLERKTASGIVAGRRDGAAWAFLGIPYAAPPVGEARFAEPRPPASWSGVREATSFGPPAPQTSLPVLKAPVGEAGGDDWLTLNIWTPRDADDAALPVMVWLHGGGFLMGTAAEPDYNGQRIAVDGRVVVVTLNFRVGFEGFAQIDGAPANRGLLDVVAALEWIKQNIGEFGGDNDRVTVFGQSAGALMAATLLAMPRAQGLFSRMIVQSPPGSILTGELAADITGFLLRSLGHRTSVADLGTTDPRELAASLTPVLATVRQRADRWGLVALGGVPFAPVIDGDVLPRTPWDAVAGGAARDVELVVGHTRDESRLFLTLAGALGSVSVEQAAGALRAYAPAPHGPDAYRAAFPDATPAQLFEIVQSDATFRMPAIHLADAQAQGGGRVFAYELTWNAPAQGGALGACHCLDYGLVFGIRTAGLTALLTNGATEAERAEYEAISGDVRRRWTAFAEHGDPGWSPYDSTGRLVQVIDRESGTAPYPEETSRRIWAEHPPRPLPLLVTGSE
ncbi:carboxylesterase/lipase family protein [Streptomyces justiciae]|uniref:carboxylesterase/lipase family protein n=1 Tax=Streptomyces justiciae TaxID=2780140 RepID=UPI0021183064|nr:carboxylesterase family protein [Streptomyces justiciae]MCW8379726.1 carboxylesterase family protein [Streptomyces justiciae]